MIVRATFAASPLMEVPLDVVVHILSFLEPFDLCAVAQVCTVRSLLAALCPLNLLN
jgi:myo-inositol catabolism protein IolC